MTFIDSFSWLKQLKVPRPEKLLITFCHGRRDRCSQDVILSHAPYLGAFHTLNAISCRSLSAGITRFAPCWKYKIKSTGILLDMRLILGNGSCHRHFPFFRNQLSLFKLLVFKFPVSLPPWSPRKKMSPLYPSGSLHSATVQLALDGGACLVSSVIVSMELGVLLYI